MPVLAQFWGKAQPEKGATEEAHPLVAHCLDVAAVAVLLAGREGGRLDPRMLGFLVALHDIGKFSRAFQAQAREHWPVEWLGAWPMEKRSWPRHDAVGAYFLSRPLAPRLTDLLPERAAAGPVWKPSDRDRLWRAVAGHHGRPTEIPARLDADVACAACHDAAGQFLDAMREVFRPPAWPRPMREKDVPLLSWRLAGLTTLADWIGSRQQWFPYVSAVAVTDPGAYFWGHALPRAAAALAEAGLAHARVAPFTGLRGLFPGITLPTPVQAWAETVPLPEGPSLTVIEDLTGSGKTEAAVTLAHRLLASGRAEGVYLALPTMATANAMHRRLATAYQALFDAGARPSLALAHGRAELNPRFMAAIDGDPREAGPREAGPRGADPRGAVDAADEPAESHCAAWLAHDRRRALLAQVGVGTLDQALLAVLPVRHAPLRLRGLTGKVLIVDEVHAFDPYMREELVTLLRFHAALGGSAILLSATLPFESRQKLVNAFLGGLRAPGWTPGPERRAYPLATLAGAAGVEETYCAPREGLPRRVTVTRLADAAAAVERIATAHAAGAAVVWIRNTVNDAIDAARMLRAQGIEAVLFHARFAMADRLAIEDEVLRVFGPPRAGDPRAGEARDGDAGSGRGGEARPERNRVLVATQVVEQSLDLDFDLMVTDVAPADLLIQRAGRLWRHARGLRPVSGPELLVVSPEPVADPASDWIKASLPGTGAVYRDDALLWRSARAVFRRGAIVTPDDMRPLIEEAFDREAEGAVPPGLARSSLAAEGSEMSLTCVAKQNLLDLDKGYATDTGDWNPDTKTPTRIENEPHVTLRLAVMVEGRVVPYARDPDPRRAWALSEVSVAQRLVAACPAPAALEAAVLSARAHWGRWEREALDTILVALLVPDGEGYRFETRVKSGAARVARYDARSGLSWIGEEPAPAG